MSTGKGSRSKRDPHLPGFIRNAQKAGEQAQICVRIPQTLRNSFERAQHVLRERGMDMQLADVVRLAIQDACRLVAERYGDTDHVASDNLGKTDTRNTQGVEHSSNGPVEECGAEAKNSGSSTNSEAPTPQGSRSARSVERGGGFEGKNGAQHG